MCISLPKEPGKFIIFFVAKNSCPVLLLATGKKRAASSRMALVFSEIEPFIDWRLKLKPTG